MKIFSFSGRSKTSFTGGIKLLPLKQGQIGRCVCARRILWLLLWMWSNQRRASCAGLPQRVGVCRKGAWTDNKLRLPAQGVVSGWNARNGPTAGNYRELPMELWGFPACNLVYALLALLERHSNHPAVPIFVALQRCHTFMWLARQCARLPKAPHL